MKFIYLKNYKKLLWHIVIIALYVAAVIAIRFKPITQAFELDYDEGLNLIKSFLYCQGFTLYTQIWNDQPPLFTVILSSWLLIFGRSVFAARWLVLLFSGLLIWCFYNIVVRQIGTIAGLCATIFLFTSWMYIRLSISVAIGLPSLALALLSIYFIILYKENHRQVLLALSGCCMALSLQTKLFSVFLVPLLLLEICNFDFRFAAIRQWKNLSLLMGIWLASCGFTYILISLPFHQFVNREQTIQSHLNQPIDNTIVNFNNLKFIQVMINQDYDFIFLAVVGIVAIIFNKQQKGLLPLAWLGCAVIILLKHQPIWYHHYLLLAIPLCWLAGYGVKFILNLCSSNWFYSKQSLKIHKLILAGLFSAVFILLVIVTPPNNLGKPASNSQLLQIVLQHKKSTRWLFTDRPIYGFYAGVRVPPEIAVMSYKRLNSKQLTSQDLLAVLQKYHPEQIVLARWTSQINSEKALKAYLDQHYFKTYTNDKGTEEHYIIQDILEK